MIADIIEEQLDYLFNTINDHYDTSTELHSKNNGHYRTLIDLHYNSESTDHNQKTRADLRNQIHENEQAISELQKQIDDLQEAIDERSKTLVMQE
jgi:peptidoglycan hydrolase CwlO-like protein